MSTTSGPACAGMDTRIFVPGPGDTADATEAVMVCFSCPIRLECLEGAIARKERYGIYGGLSYRERRQYAARRRQEQPA